MQLKKNPKADLEDRRGLFFEIGLLASLLLAFLVFGLGSKKRPDKGTSILYENTEFHAPIEFIEMPDFSPRKEIVPVSPQKVTVPVVADILTVVGNGVNLSIEIDSAGLTVAEETQEAVEDAGENTEDQWLEEVIEEDTPVIMSAESMPLFDNGDLNAFRRWVASRFNYPEKAREQTIQGIVTVEFYVDRDGRVTDARILSAPDPLLGNEVLRVVSESPDWAPGMREGRAVKFKYIMDVDIRLTRRQ